MAKFVLSAFSDEYSHDFDEQLEGLAKNGLSLMEIRGVNGKNISAVTPDEARELKKKLDDAGIAVGALGSPLGKIKLSDDYEEHLESLKRQLELAHILGTENIRMFSFYLPKDVDPITCRGEVMEKLSGMLKIVQEDGGTIKLCHENEKGIYGDTPERCYDIQKYFNSEIKQVFDHANFLCCGCEAYPAAYELLGDSIYYMHIKDADYNSKIYAAGKGLGRIPETLADLNAKRDDTIMLTVEPHLKVFKGLDALEGGQHALKLEEGTFATSADAFAYAVKCIKDILAAL